MFKINVLKSSSPSNPHIYPLNKYFVTNVLSHAFTNRLLKCSLNGTDLLQPGLLEIWSNVDLCHAPYLKHVYLITQEMHLGIFDKGCVVAEAFFIVDLW